MLLILFFFFFQAEDGIRDLVRSRGLGDVYKRQMQLSLAIHYIKFKRTLQKEDAKFEIPEEEYPLVTCLLYTSDAADERSSVDLGGRRIIKKKNKEYIEWSYRNIANNRNITEQQDTI